MNILKNFKIRIPFFGNTAKPKSMSDIEKAVTRTGVDHAILSMDFDLGRRVSSMDGWVEDEKGTRTNVSWSSLGLAYVNNARSRQFDLVIRKEYDTVC